MTGWVVAAVLAAAVAGLASYVVVTPTSVASGGASPASRFGPGAGPFAGAGGTFGTVDAVSASSFTMTTRTGTTITVGETASTTYRSAAGSASAGSITAGARVIVEGSQSGSALTATEVIVLPTGGFGGFGPGGGTGFGSTS